MVQLSGFSDKEASEMSILIDHGLMLYAYPYIHFEIYMKCLLPCINLY